MCPVVENSQKHLYLKLFLSVSQILGQRFKPQLLLLDLKTQLWWQGTRLHWSVLLIPGMFVYLFIYSCIIHSLVHLFIHTRAPKPSRTQVKFSSGISREAKINTILHHLLPNTSLVHTQSGYTVVWLNRALFVSAENYASDRNQQKFN